MGQAGLLQNSCGEIKHDELLKTGLWQLKGYEENIVPHTFAYNPHELVRLLEVFDILTVSQIIINACLARKSSSKPLCFIKYRSGKPTGGEDKKLITLKNIDGQIIINSIPSDFFGDLAENYERYNKDYMDENN
jgi:hypothetical protein